MGALMIGSMAGSILSTNSSGNINDSCKSYADAKKTLKDTTDKWSNITSDLKANKAKLKDFGRDLVTKRINYKNQLKNIKLAFIQNEKNTIITISIFILSIVIGFILKYFNVFSNIWHLFVK